MTLTPIQDTANEADASGRNNSGASESPRIHHDSFSRRGFSSETRPSASPATTSRILNHRPSPLVLPPPPKIDFDYGRRGCQQDQNDDSNRETDSRSRSPGNSTLDTSRKRLYSSDSADDDDNDRQIHGYGSQDGQAVSGRPDSTITQTPMAAYPDDLRCLCPKPPKVKRPRNSFILYRQHTQSQVVAENPGIANPRISQIIGDKWKRMSEEEKRPWNDLYKEEIERHRELYPDYKYQPKRTKKDKGRRGSSGEHDLGAEDDAGPDAGRCERCGRRNIAPLPSARLIPSSARSIKPPPSPFGSARGGMRSATLGGFSINGHRSSAPFPTPGIAPQRQSPPHSRHPLPPSNQPGARHSSPHGHVNYQDDDMPTPSPEEKRRRYDPPTPYGSHFSPSVASEGSRHSAYALPHRPRHYNDTYLPPQVPHPASVPHFPSGSLVPTPSSPWMGPPPPPMRHPMRGYIGHNPPMGEPSTPRSAHQAREDGYGPASGRLPPPLHDSRGYYQGPSSCGATAPSTAMAGLSMHQPPTPTPVTPSFARPMDPSKGAASNRERLLYQMHPRPTSGFTDESLELPPLMAGMPPVLQAARQRYTDSVMANGHASPAVHGPVGGQLPIQMPAQGPSRMQNMQTFASTPTPIMAKDYADDSTDKSAVDKDTQASGVRAMVMSLSYLKKLEVLQRICPPRPMPHKRGPIIAIEGHNAALREVVGRVVERALVQSGEFDVGVWTMSQSEDGEKGSGEAPVALSPESGGDCSSLRGSPSSDAAPSGSLSFTVKSIYDCMQLASVWHKKSNAVLKHVTSATGQPESSEATTLAAAATATSSAPQKDKTIVVASSSVPFSAGPPSPATSPAPVECSPVSMSPTIRVATPSESTGTPEADLSKGASAASASASPAKSPPPPAAHESSSPHLLPVALLTTGYSLAISDKCAISVGIDDSYAPVDHWEYMATMWRSIPGPDLVVYADASPPPPGPTGGPGPTVHTVEQEGVLIVHFPLSNASVQGAKDSTAEGESSIIDQKTERRLAFEIMEFVRSGNFGLTRQEA